MQLFSKLNVLGTMLLISSTQVQTPASGLHRSMILATLNQPDLAIESSYEQMVDDIQSAIFSKLNSDSRVSQKQVAQTTEGIASMVLQFKNPIPTEDLTRFEKDDAFSNILHTLFNEVVLPQIQKGVKDSTVPTTSLDVLSLYEACLHSVEEHMLVPSAAFPFLFASDKFITLLARISRTSSLMHGNYISIIGNTLAVIRELFERADIDSIHSASFASALIDLRDKFAKDSRSFFAIIPEEYSAAYPHIVMNAFNAFRLLENMLSMPISMLQLSKDSSLDMLKDIIYMVKDHCTHVVIGCIKRAVPTAVVVKTITAPKAAVVNFYNYATGKNSYPQDLYPTDAFIPSSGAKATAPVVASIPATVPVVISAEEDSVPDLLVATEDPKLASAIPQTEPKKPSGTSKKPDNTLRNLVLGLLALATLAALACIPLYFLRKRSL